jgi:hypothetical protein
MGSGYKDVIFIKKVLALGPYGSWGDFLSLSHNLLLLLLYIHCTYFTVLLSLSVFELMFKGVS